MTPFSAINIQYHVPSRADLGVVGLSGLVTVVPPRAGRAVRLQLQAGAVRPRTDGAGELSVVLRTSGTVVTCNIHINNTLLLGNTAAGRRHPTTYRWGSGTLCRT